MEGPPAAPINANEPHRTIAFAVDDLGTSAESIGLIRSELRKFIREQLQPNDLVAIIRTAGSKKKEATVVQWADFEIEK